MYFTYRRLLPLKLHVTISQHRKTTSALVMAPIRKSTRLAASVQVMQETAAETPETLRPTKRLKTTITSEFSSETVFPDSSTQKKRKTTRSVKGETKAEDYRQRVSSPWKIGAHVSAAGGVENAIQNAASLGYTNFSFLITNKSYVELLAIIGQTHSLCF